MKSFVCTALLLLSTAIPSNLMAKTTSYYCEEHGCVAIQEDGTVFINIGNPPVTDTNNKLVIRVFTGDTLIFSRSISSLNDAVKLKMVEYGRVVTSVQFLDLNKASHEYESVRTDGVMFTVNIRQTGDKFLPCK